MFCKAGEKWGKITQFGGKFSQNFMKRKKKNVGRKEKKRKKKNLTLG